MVETLSDGRQYTVQWFERGRFELHPENAPPSNVLLGLLGREVREAGTPQQPQQPQQPADPCADVPAPVSATITPRCGPGGTVFLISIFGFKGGEPTGFWITLPDGSIFGTVETVQMTDSGRVDDLPLETDSDWPKGLYSVVFEGTESKHQSVVYFKLQ
jgi:hypothetical protein